MKNFSKWLEAVNPALVSYNDVRYKHSTQDVISKLKDVLRPHVDTSRYEIVGHGLRNKQDALRVFKRGLQQPNTAFQRCVITIFESGVPFDNQPDEAFDTLLQWPFANRRNIMLINVPPGNPESVWRKIKPEEERSFIPTALKMPIEWTIDPQWMVGCLDVTSMTFMPSPSSS